MLNSNLNIAKGSPWVIIKSTPIAAMIIPTDCFQLINSWKNNHVSKTVIAGCDAETKPPLIAVYKYKIRISGRCREEQIVPPLLEKATSVSKLTCD